MPRNWFLALMITASALGISAQQPKTVNTHFHLGPVAPGLSATVNGFQHSNAFLFVFALDGVITSGR
jgi:hypothetical protein